MARISLIFIFLFTRLISADPLKPLSGLNLEGFDKIAGTQEEWNRNPFSKDQDEMDLRKPKLNMIVFGEKGAAALINGRAVRKNTRIGASKVASIQIGEVLLMGPSGTIKLKFSGPRPKTVESPYYYIELREAPLGEAVKLLAIMQNKNVVMPGKLDELVTASFPKISLEGAMQSLLESRGMAANEKNNVVRIMTLKDQEALGADLITRVFLLKYAKAKEIKEQAAMLVSARGTVMIDERTNSLTMRDSSNYIKNMETFIEQIDFADKQVLIEARVVEANTSFIQNLGIQWGVKVDTSGFKMDGVPKTGTTTVAGTGTGTTVSAPTVPVGPNYINTTPAKNPLAALAIGIPFSNSQLDFELSAAENNQTATVLSRPSIITTNNQPATIHSGQTIFLQIPGALGVNPSGSLGTVGNLQNIKAGITMVVTPQITADGKIRLNIDVTSSTFTQANVGNNQIQIADNNAKTQVLLADGETTVLGGLYQSSNSNAKGGVPFLSRIPFIGALFRNSSDAREKRELLVFIKPKIIEAAVKELDRTEKEVVNPLL